MQTRRGLLTACAAAAVGFAGCNDAETDRPRTDGRTTPEPGPQPSPEPDDRIDITDHGAAVDGETDDTAAIRAAIDAAEPGDVVTFPAGTTLVSTDDKTRSGAAAIPIEGGEHADDLTLRGQGADTVVRMDGGHESNHKVFEVRVRSGIEGFRLEGLTIDGAADDQIQPRAQGGWNVNVSKADDASVVPDVTIHGVRALNANQNGFRVAHGGCSLVRCTARGCELHGFVVDSWGEERNVDPPVAVRHCYAVDNGLYGIDCSGGKSVVEDFVAEQNSEGTKTTPEVLEAVYRRCRFADNETFGYNRPTTRTKTGERATVRFENVVSEGNGRAGFRFGFDTDYRVETVLARRNNGTGTKGANVMIRDNAAVDAALVMSYDAGSGPGLRYGSDAPSRIETYVHADNPGGDIITDNGGLDVGEILTRDAFREERLEAAEDVVDELEEFGRLASGGIRDVPRAAEVGAGSVE